MPRFLDDPTFSANVFFPRPDDGEPPSGAWDLAIPVDGARLHARLHPAARPLAALILFHGNGEVVSDYDGAAPHFARAGARLAVVDYRGYGRSSGDPSLGALLADARPVVDALRPHLAHEGRPLPILIMGRSLGSAAAAELSRSLPRFAAGFVLESGFSDLVAFARRRGVRLDLVAEDDLEALCPKRKLAASSAPLLVLHGAEDTLIPAAEGAANHAAAGTEDKRLVLVPGRGHNDLSFHPLYWEALGAFVGRAAEAADRRAGSLVAQALGDALGFLVEGEAPAVCAHFADQAFSAEAPPARRRGPFSFGQYSDDTQLARELGLSLIETLAWSPADFAARVARLFAEGTIVGRGRATESAARRLLSGTPWDQAGEPPPSAGNGAAMRAAPAGLRCADPAERLRVTDEHARVTHADPRARAAAILVADVVADACARRDLAGVGGAPWCEALAARVTPLDPALAAGVRRLPGWLAGPPPQAAAEIAAVGATPGGDGFGAWPGISPFATPSALYAVYAYARTPSDAEAVLHCAISAGGDVDTVAAMAGAMVGASVGIGGLGARLTAWSARLNDQGKFGRDALIALGHALA
jgi:ADP-ribosylglycohydrolase/alpha-beta hydrolase superfamily lysophospholipase